MSVKLDEKLYQQHKQRAERGVRKLVIFLAGLFIFIVVGAFFV